MKTECATCKGKGEKKCCECDNYTECKECDGTGEVEKCLSEFTDAELPARMENRDEIIKLRKDAIKAKSDHAKLCELNPRAKESYDSQLKKTLFQINEVAEYMADPD